MFQMPMWDPRTWKLLITFPDPRGRMLGEFDRECQNRFQRKLAQRSGKTQWWMNQEVIDEFKQDPKIEHKNL